MSGVEKQLIEGDRLYLIAESLAQDFSLVPTVRRNEKLPGMFTRSQIARRTKRLSNLDIDSYIERVVSPAENKNRTPAPEVIRQLGKVDDEDLVGPYFSATVAMDFGDDERRIGFIAQNRASENGIWGPDHHLRAADYLAECAKRRIPVVTFMDTPGADAREDANRANQAHSISRLITEASNVDVPNVGVIYGLGYSGGAIPLAASNMILSLRDGVFSTIQPPGLANIARRLNLSWQEVREIRRPVAVRALHAGLYRRRHRLFAGSAGQAREPAPGHRRRALLRRAAHPGVRGGKPLHTRSLPPEPAAVSQSLSATADDAGNRADEDHQEPHGVSQRVRRRLPVPALPEGAPAHPGDQHASVRAPGCARPAGRRTGAACRTGAAPDLSQLAAGPGQGGLRRRAVQGPA